MSAYMWAVPVARPLFRFLFRMKFYGFENIPKEGCLLYTSRLPLISIYSSLFCTDNGCKHCTTDAKGLPHSS